MISKLKRILFHNTSTRQTVAKNTIWLGISNIGGRLLRSIVIIYAIRLLGANDWGIFSYAVTLGGFLTIFIDMGINPVLTKSIASGRTDDERSQLLSTAFFIKIFLLTFGVLFIFFVAPRFTNIAEVKMLLPLIALIFIFDTLREFGFSLIRALEKMQYETGLYLLTNVAIVISGFYFLYRDPTVYSLALSYIIGSGIGTVATFYVLRHHFRQLLTRFHKSLVKQIFSLAWPFAISGLLGGLMLNTDTLLLGWFRSPVEVGLYATAQRIIQLLYTLPAIIAVSVLPAFSRLAQHDNEKFRRALERVTSVVISIAIPMAIGGIILGSGIIDLLFGPEYALAATPFKILMLTILIDFPAAILTNGIFSYNRQKNLMIYAAIGGFGNVILDLLLIPRFGNIGSAVATLLAQTISNVYLWQKMKSINQFHVLPHLKKTILSGISMGIIIYAFNFLGLPVIVNIPIGILAYLGSAHVLKDPLLKEIRSIFGTSA